jgi:hypothetical protein
MQALQLLSNIGTLIIAAAATYAIFLSKRQTHSAKRNIELSTINTIVGLLDHPSVLLSAKFSEDTTKNYSNHPMYGIFDYFAEKSKEPDLDRHIIKFLSSMEAIAIIIEKGNIPEEDARRLCKKYFLHIPLLIDAAKLDPWTECPTALKYVDAWEDE